MEGGSRDFLVKKAQKEPLWDPEKNRGRKGKWKIGKRALTGGKERFHSPTEGGKENCIQNTKQRRTRELGDGMT